MAPRARKEVPELLPMAGGQLPMLFRNLISTGGVCSSHRRCWSWRAADRSPGCGMRRFP